MEMQDHSLNTGNSLMCFFLHQSHPSDRKQVCPKDLNRKMMMMIVMTMINHVSFVCNLCLYYTIRTAPSTFRCQYRILTYIFVGLVTVVFLQHLIFTLRFIRIVATSKRYKVWKMTIRYRLHSSWPCIIFFAMRS